MKMKKAASVLSAVVATLMFSATVYASTQSIMVSGNTSSGENQPGWLFNRDISTATPYEFNAVTASTGIGSLYVLPIGSTAADKFIGENFINKPVSDITTISYDFKIGTGGDATDKAQFYMNVYANFGVSDDFKFYDCRYNVVPTIGSTSGFTTVTFDPTQAYPVTTRGGASSSPFTCPAVPADMNLLSAGSTVRAFALNVGDTSTSDVGLDGYLDNVVVTLGSDMTVYDFEPALTPSDKDECKKNGWMMFNTPFFKNQGDCVSFTQSSSHALGNKNK
jgi:hypothetical protein